MATATRRPRRPRRPAADSYLELIEEFPLRRITSASAHAAAKRLVLRASAVPMDRGVAEYVDVLVDLIADYEKRANQAIDSAGISPAELVRHRLGERGLSISGLARMIGVPQSNLSEMLNGRRDWSKTAIRGLAVHLNISPDRFFR